MNSTREQSRFTLGKWIVGLGVGGVILVSVVAIKYADSDNKDEMACLVFASTLPLLGTWIGTVLAFYFARENLTAASQTTLNALQLAGTFNEDLPVSALMTPLEKIRPIRRVTSREAAGDLKLSEMYDGPNGMKRYAQSRVPIVTEDGSAPLYVVHEPDLDNYAQQVATRLEDLPDDATLAQLIAQDEKLKKAVETFVTVGPKATVADARQELQRVSECKDVFVTESGTATGTVLGWLTNSDSARAV